MCFPLVQIQSMPSLALPKKRTSNSLVHGSGQIGRIVCIADLEITAPGILQLASSGRHADRSSGSCRPQESVATWQWIMQDNLALVGIMKLILALARQQYRIPKERRQNRGPGASTEKPTNRHALMTSPGGSRQGTKHVCLFASMRTPGTALPSMLPQMVLRVRPI